MIERHCSYGREIEKNYTTDESLFTELEKYVMIDIKRHLMNE